MDIEFDLCWKNGYKAWFKSWKRLKLVKEQFEQDHGRRVFGPHNPMFINGGPIQLFPWIQNYVLDRAT